jgi:hypothetical protein
MVNGKPTCGNPNLTAVLREDWKFDGYITSDTDACGDIYKTHKYAKDGEHATRDCLAGGTDINSGGTYKSYLASGIKSGVVPDASARTALRNAFRVRMRLGLFDPKVPNKNRDIGTEEIGSAAHKASSAFASLQSMVLLKNDGGVLPFAPGGKLAVVGTSADSIDDTMGNYNGDNICPRKPTDASAAGKRSAPKTDCLTSFWAEMNATNAAAGGTAALVTTKSGGWDAAMIAKAVAAATAAEQVILVVSNAATEGGESHDVSTIALEKTQMAMATAVLKAVAEKNRKNGGAGGGAAVKVAMVLVNGAVIAIDGLRDEAPAILEAFMPGTMLTIHFTLYIILIHYAHTLYTIHYTHTLTPSCQVSTGPRLWPPLSSVQITRGAKCQ